MKNTTRFAKFALLAIFIIGLSACSKDNINLLTEGVWDFSNMTTNSTDGDIITAVATWKAVRTDATLRFSSDDSYVITSPLFNETGTWELVGSTQLIFSYTGGGGVNGLY